MLYALALFVTMVLSNLPHSGPPVTVATWAHEPPTTTVVTFSQAADEQLAALAQLADSTGVEQLRCITGYDFQWDTVASIRRISIDSLSLPLVPYKSDTLHVYAPPEGKDYCDPGVPVLHTHPVIGFPEPSETDLRTEFDRLEPFAAILWVRDKAHYDFLTFGYYHLGA